MQRCAHRLCRSDDTRRTPQVFATGRLAANREQLQSLRPAQEAIDTTRLNLLLSTPVIPKENILLIEGTYDLFAERQPIEELWHKWRQPEIWRLPHGHITALFVPGLMGRVLRWLTPRLNLRSQLQSAPAALP